MRTSNITPKFTDRIPQTLDEGILYISERFSTSAHNCCCGCGYKVVLPLKDGKWSLRKNGARVSLSPSVGNWSLPCQSHYWITNNKVLWSGQFTESQIRRNRAQDKKASELAHTERRARERGFWRRFCDNVKTFFFG